MSFVFMHCDLTTSASQLFSPVIPNFCSTEQMSDERRLLIQSTQLVADRTTPSLLALMTVNSGFYINLYPFMKRSHSSYIGMAYKATYKSFLVVGACRISKTTTSNSIPMQRCCRSQATIGDNKELRYFSFSLL
jgi:hypothetical protein